MSTTQRATQQRAVERQGAILTAARELMISEGMKAVTHRRVAERATVPSASVRYYFSSREDLLSACVDALEDDRARAAQRILAEPPSDLSPAQIGVLLLRTIWGDDTSDATLVGAVGSALDGVRESAALSDRMRQQRTALDRDVRQVLDRHGLPSVDVDVVTAVVNGSIVDAAAEGHAGIAERVATTVATLLAGYRAAP